MSRIKFSSLEQECSLFVSKKQCVWGRVAEGGVLVGENGER